MSAARSLKAGTKPYWRWVWVKDVMVQTGGLKMKISARNVLDGTVKDVKKGATTAHVFVDANGATITSSITNEAVDDLGLKAGMKVKVVIKSSDVMLLIE
jgi:molybdopterin-binding protein